MGTATIVSVGRAVHDAAPVLKLDGGGVRRLVLKRLRALWPRVTFTVSCAKGSLDVSWTDGPTWDAVAPEIRTWASMGFDGMIDMAFYKSVWVNKASGEVRPAYSAGTLDSRGSCAGYSNPTPEGENWFALESPVRYGGNIQRKPSDEVVRQWWAETQGGGEPPTMERWRWPNNGDHFFSQWFGKEDFSSL